MTNDRVDDALNELREQLSLHLGEPDGRGEWDARGIVVRVGRRGISIVAEVRKDGAQDPALTEIREVDSLGATPGPGVQIALIRDGVLDTADVMAGKLAAKVQALLEPAFAVAYWRAFEVRTLLLCDSRPLRVFVSTRSGVPEVTLEHFDTPHHRDYNPDSTAEAIVADFFRTWPDPKKSPPR